MVSEPALMDVKAAAEYLGGISEHTLRKHAQRGNVRVTKIGSRILFKKADLDAAIKRGIPSLSSSKE